MTELGNRVVINVIYDVNYILNWITHMERVENTRLPTKEGEWEDM
jgi:hypothetical protein